MFRSIAVTLVFVVQSDIALAHHAFAKDYTVDNVGTIEGVVQEVFYANPHGRVYVEVTNEDGEKEMWDAQTMNLNGLTRMGWKKDSVKAGEHVVIYGNLGRNNTKRINILTLTQDNGNVFRPMNRRSDPTAGPGRSAGGGIPSVAAGIAPGEYELDETHAYLEFSYSHLGLSNPRLRFNEFDALLDLDGQSMENSSIEVRIDAASVDSTVAVFNDELKGEGFFNVASYPEITFTSTAYEQTAPNTGKLTGDLTIKDVAHPITLDVRINAANANVMSQRDTIGFSATGSLKRSDYGFEAGLPMVGDEVALRIHAEFEKTE